MAMICVRVAYPFGFLTDPSIHPSCSFHADHCDPNNNIVPERKHVTEMDKAVVTLDQSIRLAMGGPAGGSTSSGADGGSAQARLQRIVHEMRELSKAPHPAVDVWPCKDDIGFWRLILQGPDGTPYAGGTWCLYVRFPPDYPHYAPECRFATPIKAANVNCYGRICHSIFDRNYTPATTVRVMIDCIYGLLLNPDVSDPLDSTLALDFYSATGAYEAQIMAFVKNYARYLFVFVTFASAVP